MPQPPIDLYFWPTPNGKKISVMLEECALPYVIKPINISKDEQFAPDFLKISPNNKIPAIVDPNGPDGAPVSVFESGAILLYLARKTGQLYPTSVSAQIAVDQWLMFQMGGFGPMLGQNHHFRLYAPETVPYAITRYLNETKRLYGVLNQRLSDHPFVAGADYSIADIALLPWAVLWEKQGMDLADFPHVQRWLDQLLARDGVQRGLAWNGDNIYGS